MAINYNRPIITYENIALFRSDSPAWNESNNSGSGLSFVPLLQSMDLGFSIKRDDVAALGSKSKISRKISELPVIDIGVNVYEDFGAFWSGLMESGSIAEDLNKDFNMYAVLGDTRGQDIVKKDSISGFDAMSIGNCFLNSISLSQSVGEMMRTEYGFTAYNLEVHSISEENSIQSAAVDLSGSQTGAISAYFDPIQSYYDTGNFLKKYISHGDTNIVISGQNREEPFFVEPDIISRFSLQFSINRREVHSIGKKYPIVNRAIYPIEGSFGLSLNNSAFATGTDSSLRDYIDDDQKYSIFLDGQNMGGEPFSFVFRNTSVSNFSKNASVGSQMSSDLDFDIDLSDQYFNVYSPPDVSRVSLESMTAYYKFDDGAGDASEASGRGHSLINYNSTPYGDGAINSGALLNGTFHYFKSTPLGFNFKVPQDLTLSVWVKMSSGYSTSSEYYLATRWNIGAVPYKNFRLIKNTSNKFEFTVSDNGSNETSVAATGNIEAERWYHIVAAYKPSTYLRLYIDGELDSENTTSIPSNLYEDTTVKFFVGSREGVDRFHKGSIDEIGIWERQLEQGEITALANKDTVDNFTGDLTVKWPYYSNSLVKWDNFPDAATTQWPTLNSINPDGFTGTSDTSSRCTLRYNNWHDLIGGSKIKVSFTLSGGTYTSNNLKSYIAEHTNWGGAGTPIGTMSDFVGGTTGTNPSVFECNSDGDKSYIIDVPELSSTYMFPAFIYNEFGDEIAMTNFRMQYLRV
jgi:hypothetical protein